MGSHVELLDHRISQELLLKAVFSKPLVVLQTFLHGLAECYLVLLLPFQIRLVDQILNDRCGVPKPTLRNYN